MQGHWDPPRILWFSIVYVSSVLSSIAISSLGRLFTCPGFVVSRFPTLLLSTGGGLQYYNYCITPCTSLNTGSYVSAHVLLKLLNEFGEKLDARLCRASYRFFPDRSTNARLYLSHDTKIAFYLRCSH